MLPSYLQRNISTTFNSNFLILWTLHSKYQYRRVKSVILSFLSWNYPHYCELNCENSSVSRIVGWGWQGTVNIKKAWSDNSKWWNISTSTTHTAEIRTTQRFLNLNTFKISIKIYENIQQHFTEILGKYKDVLFFPSSTSYYNLC